MTTRDDRTFEAAALVASWIAADGGRSAVIGAVALAVHGYVRATRDLDLATELDPFTQLRNLGELARQQGWTVELNLPDADDPLGGVLTITAAAFDPLQVVNFYNPLRGLENPASEALDAAVPLAGVPGLRVVRVEDLILLKLYAGGLKSVADVAELVELHPELDRSKLRARARALGLDEALEGVLASG